MHGTEFTLSVRNALRQIPAGETRSYSDIASAVGRPSAVRAVARANGANPIALVVPCHRVIGMDGVRCADGRPFERSLPVSKPSALPFHL